MRDFTLRSYRSYLEAIISRGFPFLTFAEFLSMDKQPERFCLVRHDVDRKPANALAMAELESELGVKATYYFRTKPHTFDPKIILEIAGLGHEIGYHYESLSDKRGNMASAQQDFELHLEEMRKIVQIDTVSMHGRPLRPFDNRDMWRSAEQRNILHRKYRILGEVYLDIDYTDISYITDTGRNWMSTQSNKRDKVDSDIHADFESGEALLEWLKNSPHPKLVFQIHPERWSDNPAKWALQLAKDKLINLAKKLT